MSWRDRAIGRDLAAAFEEIQAGTFHGVPTRAGEDMLPAYSISAAAAFGIGDLRLMPYWVAAPATLVRLSSYTTVAAGAGGLIRQVAYLDDGTFKPGALLVDAGTVVSTGTPGLIPSATVSAAIAAAGWIWVGVVAQGSAAATVAYASAQGIQMPAGAAATAGATQAWQLTGVTGAAPASAAAAVRTSNPAITSPRFS